MNIDTKMRVYENYGSLSSAGSSSALTTTSGKDLIAVSCFGQICHDEEDQLFDYYCYKKWHIYKRLIQKWDRRHQIKLGLQKVIVDDLSDRVLKNEMAREFGVINPKCQAFDAYFNIFAKERREQTEKWKKIENEIEENDQLSQDYIEGQMYDICRKISGHTFCEDFQTEIIEFRCDWFQVSRTYDLCISPTNEFSNQLVLQVHRKKVDDSVLAKLCTKLTSCGGRVNLSVFDWAFVFPNEILQCQNISLKLSIQLKTVINEFPYGVVEEVFMSRFQEKYGTQPNFLEKHYPTFLILCNVYVDIFYVPESLPGLSGRQLIFPAYWYGILDSVANIAKKLWHMINVIVAMNSGLVEVGEIIPKMRYIFNIDLTPENWGFSNIMKLIQYFTRYISNENDLKVCFLDDGVAYLSY